MQKKKTRYIYVFIIIFYTVYTGIILFISNFNFVKILSKYTVSILCSIAGGV